MSSGCHVGRVQSAPWLLHTPAEPQPTKNTPHHSPRRASWKLFLSWMAVRSLPSCSCSLDLRAGHVGAVGKVSESHHRKLADNSIACKEVQIAARTHADPAACWRALPPCGASPLPPSHRSLSTSFCSRSAALSLALEPMEALFSCWFSRVVSSLYLRLPEAGHAGGAIQSTAAPCTAGTPQHSRRCWQSHISTEQPRSFPPSASAAARRSPQLLELLGGVDGTCRLCHLELQRALGLQGRGTGCGQLGASSTLHNTCYWPVHKVRGSKGCARSCAMRIVPPTAHLLQRALHAQQSLVLLLGLLLQRGM